MVHVISGDDDSGRTVFLPVHSGVSYMTTLQRFKTSVYLPVLILASAFADAPAFAQAEKGWFEFNPPADSATAINPIDLRSLNEKVAGENGVIGVRGSQFIHTKTGKPLVFWAVNGPASKDKE